MSEIELSTVVIDGLKSLNTVISLDLTKKIISNAVKMALHSDASKWIINKNNDVFLYIVFTKLNHISSIHP